MMYELIEYSDFTVNTVIFECLPAHGVMQNRRITQQWTKASFFLNMEGLCQNPGLR